MSVAFRDAVEFFSTVEGAFGHEMYYVFRAALDPAFDDEQTRPSLRGGILEQTRPHHDIGDIDLVAQYDERPPSGVWRGAVIIAD